MQPMLYSACHFHLAGTLASNLFAYVDCQLISPTIPGSVTIKPYQQPNNPSEAHSGHIAYINHTSKGRYMQHLNNMKDEAEYVCVCYIYTQCTIINIAHTNICRYMLQLNIMCH